MISLIASRSNCTKFFLIVVSITMACTGKRDVDPKALEYVSKATQAVVSPGRREVQYPKAILYLDSAIAKDKTCKVAYSNKIRLLSTLKRYREALVVVDQLVVVSKNAPYATLHKAIVLKKLKDLSASGYFEKALHQYNKALEEFNPDQKDLTNQYLLHKSYCLYFLEGRKASIDQLGILKRRLSEDRSIDFLIGKISYMTEEQFLEGLL